MSEMPPGDRQSGRRRRSDAEENIERIVRAATELLRVDPEAALEDRGAAEGHARRCTVTSVA